MDGGEYSSIDRMLGIMSQLNCEDQGDFEQNQNIRTVTTHLPSCLKDIAIDKDKLGITFVGKLF